MQDMHLSLYRSREFWSYWALFCYKFRNVLQDEAGHLKVTDFGLSKNAHEKDAHGYKMTGGTGTCMTSHLTEDWMFWQSFGNHTHITFLFRSLYGPRGLS